MFFDGLEKSSGYGIRRPAEWGVLMVRRNDEGYAKYRNADIGLFTKPSGIEAKILVSTYINQSIWDD